MYTDFERHRATILLFFVNLAVKLSPSVTLYSNNSLITEYLGFVNIAACLVFRGVALGVIEESPGLSSTRIAAAMELSP